jgi:sugar phosphate isomerase/epimerase
MKVCLNDHTLYGSGMHPDAFAFLELARELELGGIQFAVLTSFGDEVHSTAQSIRARAEEYGLALEIGMGSCNPFSSCRAPRDTDRNPRESLREAVSVAHALGSPVVRTFFGYTEERFFKSPTLAEQLDATLAVLREVAPVAEDQGVKIAMENHLALTSYELRELIERVGSPAIGVCFDTANSMMLLEDPLDACRTLLPWICTTHVKDGALCFDAAEGARWFCCLLGDGSCRIRETLTLIRWEHPEVNLHVEDLWDTFRVPLFDRDFLRGLRHLGGQDIGLAVRWLQEGERLAREGRIPTRQQLEGEGRWEIVRNRFPLDLERARELLRQIEGEPVDG